VSVRLRSVLFGLLLFVVLSGACWAAPGRAPETLAPPTSWTLLTSMLSFLVPIGFLLLAIGGLEAEAARQATLAGMGALALGMVGYFATGFAFQFGGIGLVQRGGGLEGLIWEWSALDLSWGTGWGMAGVHGFGLTGGASTAGALSLFFSQLPWVMTATLVLLLTLRGRTPAPVAAIGGLLMSALIYPVAGNWVLGAGWLANLGTNLGLGHGFVDFAGSSNVHLLGASTAAAAILVFLSRRPRGELGQPVPLPPVHLPILAVSGVGLLFIGTLAWSFSSPLVDWSTLQAERVAVNLALSAGTGALLPLAYTWFTTTRPDPLMAARGASAAIIAVCAGAPFLPPLAALCLGAVVGLLVPLACYLVDHILRWNDPAAALAVHGLGGVLGLIAVGLLADGGAGRGWNGVGASEYLGLSGQGVSALWVAEGFVPDWPGQLAAQAIGLVAVAFFGFAIAGLAFGPLAAMATILRRRSEPTGQGEDYSDLPSDVSAPADESVSDPLGQPAPENDQLSAGELVD